MVARYVPVLAALSVLCACGSRDGCTEGSELMPPLCPLELPAIQSVTITENASKAAAETDPKVSCDGFRVDERVVRRYFELAKRTNENDAHHTLDYSPCGAAGGLIFANGQTGRWQLSQLRSGSLVMANGENIVLYCPTCDFEPFL